jgi:hypothetical protein
VAVTILNMLLAFTVHESAEYTEFKNVNIYTKLSTCLFVRMQENHSVNTANKFFNNMAETNRNCCHRNVKGRLNLGNAYYHSAQNLLSFHLLCKNKKA